MKKAALLCGILILSSCGGSTTNENTNESLEAPAQMHIEQNNSNTSLSNNSNTLEGAALEERKQLEQDLGDAKKILEEVKGMDIAKEQEGMKAKLLVVKEKASMLREMDDFFVDADSILQDIGALENRMNNFVQVSTLPETVNLASQNKEVEIKNIFKVGSDLYAVTSKALVGPLFKEGTKETSFPGGHLGTGGTYSIKFRESFVASLPGQVWKVTGNQLEAQTVEEGGAWYPGSELWSYGKNLYLLDPLSKKLWKYEQASGSMFKKPVLAIEDPELAKSTIRSISVDGNIYILTDKELIKFTQGKRIPLETDTPMTALSEGSVIYTDQNSNYLYIFDSKAGRFLRFTKRSNGLSLVKEYTITGNYKGFFPSPDGKNIYFFDTQKIYTLAL